ncbi:putative class II peroxidase [Annulohypoxylon maeteangense]|uniref:putative class II peroxidase n=1 Tax=Annulohypoxylon maeteangense TaxID=1927788 RepID=UPI002008D7A9|nr:putative class II peroxidase [Annulohypoxylon maeteangense]KAI0888096.1 putative class II peroxidase [Annulohypoxylon maeteangense]
MKTTTILIGLVAPQALAYPGMGRTLAQIQSHRDNTIVKRSTELLGDLKTTKDQDLTPAGSSIKSVLGGGSAIADGSTYKPLGDLASDTCKKSTLCVWYHIVQDLKVAFTDSTGCTDLARGAIRQGFHDAAAWDKDSSHGGADGSLLLSDEMSRVDNLGLEDIAAQTKGWYSQYKAYGISMADLIQTAAMTATVSCPGGPRIKHFVGRKDDSRAAPTGKLPFPYQDADALVRLFAAKTFTSNDLVALVGAHTASKQKFVDTSRKNAPQDSTPNVWDTKFYSETIAGDNKTILIFHSDKSISSYSGTQAQFKSFAGSNGKSLWSPAYAQAYFRMSFLGVNNLNNLTDISQVIPLSQ